MTDTPDQWKLRELVEDRLEEATGEPRHVTDIEIEFIPEQDEAHNWSANATCKAKYSDALDDILEQIEIEHPVMRFD